MERPALVLGSTQPDEIVDRTAAWAAGVDVVRRRSGGGAVHLASERVVWADVVVPAGDGLWDDDVGRAFWWLGAVWAAALGRLGVDVDVHRGPLVRTPLSDRVCFAGIGAGEVLAGGRRKVVGISQRRTRAAALFQCACLLTWDPDPLVGLLRWAGDGERREAAEALAGVAVGVADLVPTTSARAVESAFVAALVAGAGS